TGSKTIVGYELLINGHKTRLLPAKTRTVRLNLRRNDKRSFAIAAVDKAGNVGAPTVIFGSDLIQRSLRAAPAPARRRGRPEADRSAPGRLRSRLRNRDGRDHL